MDGKNKQQQQQQQETGTAVDYSGNKFSLD